MNTFQEHDKEIFSVELTRLQLCYLTLQWARKNLKREKAHVWDIKFIICAIDIKPFDISLEYYIHNRTYLKKI